MLAASFLQQACRLHLPSSDDSLYRVADQDALAVSAIETLRTTVLCCSGWLESWGANC